VDIEVLKNSIWRQAGASIDMLENAIVACPDEVWSDRTRQPECWYLVFHTLFWLDYYSSGETEGFAPPAPFTLDEMDPAGLLPEDVYSKDELLSYLKYGRKKCRAAIETVTEEKAAEPNSPVRPDVGVVELFLYNMRHVQHAAAQLNLLIRQQTDSAPRWVRKADLKGGLK
jgi:hypothetical protein